MENIIGQINEGVSTHSFISNFYRHTAFASQIEPKSIEKALKDESGLKLCMKSLISLLGMRYGFLSLKQLR